MRGRAMAGGVARAIKRVARSNNPRVRKHCDLVSFLFSLEVCDSVRIFQSNLFSIQGGR